MLSMLTDAARGFTLQPFYSPSFVLTKSTNAYANANAATSYTALFAKKKRRRRKSESSSSSSLSSPPPTSSSELDEDDELPDFDLIEDIDLEEMSSTNPITASTTSSAPTRSSTNNIISPPAPKKINLDLNDPSVIAAMKVTKGMEASSFSSTKDLLKSRNRELEKKLIVDDVIENVPSFADYNAKKRGNVGIGSSTTSSDSVVSGGMGKKAMRREERRAAALEAEGNELEEEENAVGKLLSQFISKLPFVESTENGEKKSAVKLLEEGTWACIYILIGWEIYINTPLFNRAAPLAPVVFQDPVTMTFLL